MTPAPEPTQVKPPGLPSDELIWATPHAEMLTRSKDFRRHWFHLLHVGHAELDRVSADLLELMNPDIDTKIITIIGPTGIGKTTLAESVLLMLQEEFGLESSEDECPVIHVSVPANGERALSYRMLYVHILRQGGETAIDYKRPTEIQDGKLRRIPSGRLTVAALRDSVESMLKHRKVRALIIDEALHLLRFQDYSAIMDTLKSLADCADTKLILIGTYQIAPLMKEYGQVVRRSEILHYRRYKVRPETPKALNEDEEEYRRQIQKFQSNWPCAERPNLDAIWHPLMRASLGSIGLTKSILKNLVGQQMASTDERLNKAHFVKALKAKAGLAQMEEETAYGEASLEGACYGDGEIDDTWVDLALRVSTPTREGVCHV